MNIYIYNNNNNNNRKIYITKREKNNDFFFINLDLIKKGRERGEKKENIHIISLVIIIKIH